MLKSIIPCALFMTVFFIFAGVLFIVPLFSYLIFYNWTPRYLVLIYLTYIYYDRETPETGGRLILSIRNLIKYMLTSYRNCKIIHLCEYDVTKNYLCGLHPHGIMASYGTSLEVPGFTVYISAVSTAFWIPLVRDYNLSIGLVSVTPKSINNILLNKEKGKILGIIVGGQRETLYATPGVHKIILKSRKGFCRIALQTGTSIIPSYAFGEVNIFNTVVFPETNVIHRIQLWILKTLRVAVHLPTRFLANQVPVNVVMGTPIEVQRVENPTNEAVSQLLEQYIKSLQTLFDENKAKYGDPNAELIIVS